MIMTEVVIPAMDESRDFLLDENASIRDVKRHLCMLLQENYKDKYAGDSFLLASVEQERFLEADQTLAECGVGNGSRLLLV